MHAARTYAAERTTTQACAADRTATTTGEAAAMHAAAMHATAVLRPDW
jgi:hypothetical protein